MEMDRVTYQTLFHDLPSHITEDVFANELRIEEFPPERVAKLRELLTIDKGGRYGLEAARLLASWGQDDGFDYLEWFVCDQPPLMSNLNPHRLRGYDDTYCQILDSLVDYWATLSTLATEGKALPTAGATARRKIFFPISKILEFSNFMPFEIKSCFLLVRRYKYTEYLPALKIHLIEILKDQKLHHWKISDVAHLLVEFDPSFVKEAFAKYRKTIRDFPRGY